MSTDEIIEVDAEVRILPPSETPENCKLWLRRGDKAQIFEPAREPEMNGRRPSGAVMTVDPAEIPPHMRPIPIMENTLNVKVPKRTAKSVAEEMTKMPVRVREEGGRCFIEIHWPHERLAFSGMDWFLALASLKNHLDEKTKPKW